MSERMRTAGVVVDVDADTEYWLEVVREAWGGTEPSAADSRSPRVDGDAAPAADVRVTLTRTGATEPGPRHRPLTRGAWSDGREVILLDACASGLDLTIHPTDSGLDVVVRPRPGWRHRALGALAPDRRVLLHRAVLVQYPAMWWAGVMGRVPLHVSAATVGGFASSAR